MLYSLLISLFRIAVPTVLLLLLTDGFLIEALSVATKEGRVDWAAAAAKQLLEQSNQLISAVLAIL